MNISRLLPLLLLVPAITMADEDRNFKLNPSNFKVGNVLEHATDMAIALDSSVAISQEPSATKEQTVCISATNRL